MGEPSKPSQVVSQPSPSPQDAEQTTGVPQKRYQGEDDHVALGWRSWASVFISCFALFSQVFVVTAAGSVIAFIIRDLGHPSLAGWIIQGPLLVQAVLSPIVGRLSDVLDRKYLAMLPPLIAVAGSVISARADSMDDLIVGGILIGVTLSTTAIIGAIPSEVLPLKHRATANGYMFVAGVIGAVVGTLGSGAVTNSNPRGWRNIFWIQFAFHLATTIGFLFLYWPQKRLDVPKMSFKSYVWSCDPIGSMLFVGWVTLMLLALDWTGGTYHWSDPHVAVPLSLGCGLLLLFCLYEWKGRSDGLMAHVFFKGGPNFALTMFAFLVEGWLFYSAFNSIVPQIILNLGFETDAWHIGLRVLWSQIPAFITSILIMWYAFRFKDLQTPLIVTFIIFLAASICYATITPSLNHAQYGYAILSGIGQAGPLILIIALIQFSSPHAYLSTATGLAYSFRAIGGAFGSAVLNSIINGQLGNYGSKVGGAAIGAGLPVTSVGPLVMGFAVGSPELIAAVPGITPAILNAAQNESHKQYAHAYRVAWASVTPFIVVAVIAILFVRNVRKLMTERIEATVELTPGHNEDKIEGT